MDETQWLEWAANHASVFGLIAPEEKKMILAWKDYFLSAGFTIPELQQASREMMAAPPKWRADHLQRIQEAITARRLKQAQAEREAEQDHARQQECPRCKGREGWLEVPHPETIRGDQWTRPYLTLLVTCDCTRGRIKFNQFAILGEQESEFRKKVPSFRPALAIDAYERRFPHWELMVQQRDLAREQEAKAMGRAAHADRHRGPIPPVAWTEVAAQCSATKSTPTA